MKNNIDSSEDIKFNIKDIKDSDVLIQDIEYFNNSLHNYFEDIDKEYLDSSNKNLNLDDAQDKIMKMCTSECKKMIVLRRKRLSKFDITNKKQIIIDSASLKKSKQKDEMYTLNASKDRIKSRFSVSIETSINETYEICSNEVFSSKSKATADYLIENINGEDECHIKDFNFKTLKSDDGNLMIKYLITASLLMIFVVGISYKMDQIGVSNMQFRYIILALILAVVIVKFIPKKFLVSKKNRKLLEKKSPVISKPHFNLLRNNPLYNIYDYYMELDYKIKAIHFAEEEEELDDFSIKIDLWDIVQKYKKVIDCSTLEYKVVNYYEGNSEGRVNILFKLELKELEYDNYTDHYGKKSKENKAYSIITRNEDVLITAQIKKLKNSDGEDDYVNPKYKGFDLSILNYRIM